MSIRSCGNSDTAGERSCCLGIYIYILILLLVPFSLCVCVKLVLSLWSLLLLILILSVIISLFITAYYTCIYIITCDEVGLHYIQIYDYTQMPVLLYPQICRHSITYYPVLEQCGSKTTGGKQFYCA